MIEPFAAAPHHDVLALVVQVAVLLVAARGFGELAQRLGQPPVVGELLAGIVLGPSLLSGIFPAVGAWIIPQTEVQGYLLEVVAMIGILLLLVITGLETDLALIAQHARTALGVSWGGITTCLLTGFLVGLSLPDSLLADAELRIVFALFVATAMTISSIPVVAKVLIDMDLIRRDIGQTILAAGMNDDTVGWILLGVAASLVGAGGVSTVGVARTVASVLAFLLVSFTVGRWLVKKALDFVQDELVSRDRLLTLVVVMAFAWGAVTHALGLEPVLGAFVMGVLFGQMRRLPEDVHDRLESMALGIFAPIFFAVAGLKVNVASLLQPVPAAVALLVILLATVAKVAGTYAGARLVGRRDHWTALSYGAGLNARGAMGIIVASIGLQLGVLSQEMFSILVLMAVVTSLMAPFALPFVLARAKPEEQELRRLRREELARESLVGRIHRVLLPARFREAGGHPVQRIEARILRRLAGGQKLSITILTAVEPEQRARASEFLEELSALFADQEVTRKVVEGRRPTDAILEEAEKNYQLLVLGAGEPQTRSDFLFNPVVDYLVRVAPCATMVVSGTDLGDAWAPRRILAPTNGTMAARRAAEVAFAVASPDPATEVTVLHVVAEMPDPHEYDWRGITLDRRLVLGHKIVEELRKIGASLGVHTNAEVRVGRDPETVILEFARTRGYDLIVLGTSIRAGSERLFLGPRVERILNHAPCPVVVVNAD